MNSYRYVSLFLMLLRTRFIAIGIAASLLAFLLFYGCESKADATGEWTGSLVKKLEIPKEYKMDIAKEREIVENQLKEKGLDKKTAKKRATETVTEWKLYELAFQVPMKYRTKLVLTQTDGNITGTMNVYDIGDNSKYLNYEVTGSVDGTLINIAAKFSPHASRERGGLGKSKPHIYNFTGKISPKKIDLKAEVVSESFSASTFSPSHRIMPLMIIEKVKLEAKRRSEKGSSLKERKGVKLNKRRFLAFQTPSPISCATVHPRWCVAQSAVLPG